MDEADSGYLVRMLEERLPEYRTLRDEFAMAAMSGMLSNPAIIGVSTAKFARVAYAQADAMLAARAEKGECSTRRAAAYQTNKGATEND